MREERLLHLGHEEGVLAGAAVAETEIEDRMSTPRWFCTGMVKKEGKMLRELAFSARNS